MYFTMKIVSASVKVVDDKNHYSFLSLEDVEITIKGKPTGPIAAIPEIQEEVKPAKKSSKKKK